MLYYKYNSSYSTLVKNNKYEYNNNQYYTKTEINLRIKDLLLLSIDIPNKSYKI